MSLYKKYRPKKFSEVLGQASALASLRRLVEKGQTPHAILFTGPSGVGKTTIARILRLHLKCAKLDFKEVNSANFRGVDTVREIDRTMNLAPIGGKSRIYLIDECHKITKDAQEALLKMLEETPDHVYFMLATTDPGKLIPAIHTRCSEVKLSLLKPDQIKKLVMEIIKKESFQVTDDVVNDLVEAADGSARKALVILEQIAGLVGEKEQIAAIQTTTVNKDTAFELTKTLMFRPDWGEIACLLRELDESEPEGVRQLVLSYARTCLIGKDKKGPDPKHAKRAFLVIDIFSKHFFDSRNAGLAAACWKVMAAE